MPILLLRSPHEIAMSLFTRSRSEHSYRTCLDVTAVHLRRLAAIVNGWPEPVARVIFGGRHYEDELARAVTSCGLDWDPERARQCFDATCVHHASAVLAHESQRLHDALGGADEATAVDPVQNLAIIEADAIARESMYREHRERDRDEIAPSAIGPTSCRLRRRRPRQLLRTITTTGRKRTGAGRRRTGAGRRRTGAGRAHRSWQEAHRSWQDAIGQLAATREELERYRRLTEEGRELAYALSRQLDAAHVESLHLQTRLLRFDSHPVLGPILRGRRHVKSALNGLRNPGGDR